MEEGDWMLEVFYVRITDYFSNFIHKSFVNLSDTMLRFPAGMTNGMLNFQIHVIQYSCDWLCRIFDFR